MKKRNSKEEIILMFGKMYKEENKSISQIAEETNYSETTVRNYLSQGNYLTKRNTYKDTTIQSKDNIQDEEIDKPYEELDSPFVLYKGKVYEKLTGEKLREALYHDLNIKKKRRVRRS